MAFQVYENIFVFTNFYEMGIIKQIFLIFRIPIYKKYRDIGFILILSLIAICIVISIFYGSGIKKEKNTTTISSTDVFTTTSHYPS